MSLRLASPDAETRAYWPPPPPPPACMRLDIRRRDFQVLLQRNELPSALELYEIAGDGTQVDRRTHEAGLSLSGVRGEDADFLRAHGKDPAVSREHVRGADEPGDELRPRMLVHLRRRADLLDLAV